MGLTYRVMSESWMLVEEPVRVEKYLEGTAEKPFATRVLVPGATKLVVLLIPESSRPMLGRLVSPFVPDLVEREDVYDPAPYAVIGLIMVLSIVAYSIVTERSYNHFFGNSRTHWWVPLATLLLLIPFVLRPVGHIYDFTSLLLQAAMLYALFVGRIRSYFLLFIIACFTKETAILTSAAFAGVYFDRMPRRRWVLLLVAQLAMFCLIYGVLAYHFRHNGGEAVYVWISDHLSFYFGSTRRFLKYAVFYIAGLILVGFRWSQKPLTLRRAAWMWIPHAGLILLASFPGEIRNFYESAPLMTLFALRNSESLVVTRFARIRGAAKMGGGV